MDIPTAVGFCVYIKRDCLNMTGLLREDAFAQGYGEEDDFCVRAGHLGWRHVAVPSVFVAHVGGQPFGSAKALAVTMNIGPLVLTNIGPPPGVDLLSPAEAGLNRSAAPLGSSRHGLLALR